MQAAPATLGRLRSPVSLAAELRRRNPVLAAVAALQTVLLAVFLAALVADPRTLAGEPLWLKPAKFAAGIAAFTGSLAWLTPHFPAPDATIRRVSLGVAAGSVVEIALIGGQAARGVESHFNTATAFDTAVYAAMGVTILAVVGLVAVLLARSWRREFAVPPAFAWGIRLGVLLFVLGSLEGGAMNAISSATTGGGQVVPGLRWRLGGDFRVAHFVGLHALEALPLVGYLAARAHQRGRLTRPLLAVALTAAAVAAVFVVALTAAVLPLL
jgi:hypothetical protein